MTITLTRREQIVASLNDKIYRDAFVADQIRIGVPLQIRAMRDERDLSQEVLGTMMSPPMKQESVWRLEKPEKSNLTIGTLLRVASALDVALVVRFVPFSELIDTTPWVSPRSTSVPEYSKDARLKEKRGASEEAPATQTAAAFASMVAVHQPRLGGSASSAIYPVYSRTSTSAATVAKSSSGDTPQNHFSNKKVS